MSDVITYWTGYTPVIGQLCDRFGYNLENLKNGEKKALRCVLSLFSIMTHRAPQTILETAYTFAESAWTAADLVEYGMCSEDVREALGILQNIEDPGCIDALIVAITAQMFDEET